MIVYLVASKLPESTQNVIEQLANASEHLHRSRKWHSTIQISCDAQKAFINNVHDWLLRCGLTNYGPYTTCS